VYDVWFTDFHKPALHTQCHLPELGLCIQPQYNVSQVGKVSDYVQLLPQSIQCVWHHHIQSHKVCFFCRYSPSLLICHTSPVILKNVFSYRLALTSFIDSRTKYERLLSMSLFYFRVDLDIILLTEPLCNFLSCPVWTLLCLMIFLYFYISVLYNLIWNCETLLQLFPIFNCFCFLLALQKPQCFSCNAATLLVGWLTEGHITCDDSVSLFLKSFLLKQVEEEDRGIY